MPIVVGQNQKQPVSKAMIKLADMIRRELAKADDVEEEDSVVEQKGKTSKFRLFGKS